MTRAEVLRRRLAEELAELPENRLQEVLNFVDYVKSQERNGEDPILKVAGCLSGNPISGKEIEAGLYGEASS